MKKKIVILAGGTGGHIYPGLAVAKLMQENDWEVSWLGTENRMEAIIVPQYDIKINFIKVVGLRGKNIMGIFKSLFKLPIAIIDSINILKKENPDVVLSMGGFVAGPAGIAAKLLKIPLVIHEQNATLGLTNKILSKFSDLNMSAFDNIISNALVVGQPLRNNFCNNSKNLYKLKEKKNSINILVLGGSQGAKILNEIVPQALSKFNKEFNVIHQSGKNNYYYTKQNYINNNIVNYQIIEFVEDIIELYKWADFVICRSGAMTVFELASLGLPAIFVPFNHKDKQQYLNAKYFYDNDDFIIEEQNFSTDNLLNKMIMLDYEQLINISDKIFVKFKPNASLKIIEQITKIVNKEKK